MRKSLIAWLALCLTLTTYAQSGSISGTIYDEDLNEPLIGASVQIVGTTKGGITDINGKFLIRDVATGSYQLKISYYGFETITKNVTVTSGLADVGNINLKSTAIGLDEVQVFADVVEERKTPVAISTITSEQLEERYSNYELADVVQNTPGIYTINGAGGYGDQEVYIRGFDQTNVAFLVNGIPVNDMENGRMFWSNFAGLNQVTRTVQVQRGLGASKLAVSSIGGTINMITKPSESRAGGRMEYQMGTGSFNSRTRFTYNTGQSANGWALSFQGSRTITTNNFGGLPSTQQGPIMPGAFADAWSYYIAASKQINDKHQIMFWAFGAPVNRGTAWTPDDLTRETFRIEEPMFNNALGIKNGELFNARQNRVDKPLMAMTHYWDMNATTSISTSVYYSYARVYSVQPTDATSSLFLQTRTPSMIGNQITAENLINWDYLMEQNRLSGRQRTVAYPNGDPNIPSVTGYASRYYLESRHNNHDWIGLVSNYTKQLRDLRIRAGIDLRHYRGEHYAQVYDLMGGDFIENRSRFGDLYNKLDTENAIAYEGDKTNYNYDGIVNWVSGFGQAEWVKDKWTFFGSATLTNSSMQRIGYFWSGNEFQGYESTSLGASEKRNFITYVLKGGANYRITGRHNVYANAGYFTRPPFLVNAFQDSRYSNNYRFGLEPENVISTEMGYSFRASFLKANVNAYYLQWNNRTTQIDINDPQSDINLGLEIPLVLNGMQSTHKGIELDFVANPVTTLELNGYIGLGDWTWTKVPNQQIVVGEDIINTDDLYDVNTLIGLPTGAAAQTTMGLGFHYTGIRSTYVGARMNYADRIPVRYTVEDVVDGFITDEVIKDDFDDYVTFDLYAGRYFDIGEKMSGRISANVNNVFNVEYTRFASYFFNQIQRGYGFPRTFSIGLSIDF